jgi:hippurate hydrolase
MKTKSRNAADMIIDDIATYADELTAIRHDLHQHPELCFEENRTAAIVAKYLKALGFNVTTGIAKTGVVGTLQCGTSRQSIGLRADMDALPIEEKSGAVYASRTPGKMHACGHDGHTATLLGAAKALATTRNFDGTVHLIFQPAEEDIGGAKRMLEEGLLKRFPMDQIFAMHNLPGQPLGQVQTRPGVITTEVSILQVTVKGVGGHGALPHLTADPVVAASAIVMALQTIVSRNLNPADIGIITVGAMHGGVLGTIIPQDVKMTLGLRSVSAEGSALMAIRVPEVIETTARAYGCTAQLVFDGTTYPAGFNNAEPTRLVRDLAVSLGQDAGLVDLQAPFMFSEDFAFIQQQAKACYFCMGNGPSQNLHDPGYDFNDALLIQGASFWTRLVQKALPKM